MSLTADARSFLDKLIATPGPAGFEAAAQEVVRGYLSARLPAAAIAIDRNDNLAATIRPEGKPHVALLAHVDTVGLIVTRIDGRGMLRVGAIGNPRAEALVGRIVTIHARTGPLSGLVFRVDDNDKKAEVADLAIDCGFVDGGRAVKAVRVGDCVSWAAPFTELADGRLVGPATDDRVGVFVACQVLLAASADRKESAPCVSAVSCIQEEGPTHMGAITTMSRLKPDLIVVVDTAGANDGGMIGDLTLGGGPAVGRGGSIHNRTSDALLELAERLKIPHQIEPVGRGSGTDLEAAMQFAGGNAAGCLISIPQRYYHTPSEMVDPRDIGAAIELLSAFVTSLPAVL